MRHILPALALSLTVCASAQTQHIADLYPNEFNPSDVELLDGPFDKAMQLNIQVLKSYDVDRLLAPLYIEAGLEPKAKPFENWAGLDGHVTGHYLSALAIHYAATGDEGLLAIMEYMLDEMQKIQQANGDGYIGGVPQSREVWDALRQRDLKPLSQRWVAWYNMHKIYAGLRDAYIYGGSEQALKMFTDLCDWGLGVIAALDDTEMERMLDIEHGGINEVYADAYDLTGDERYLDAAIRLTHHWLFDSMASGIDNLDNRHANTQVPKVVGFQRVAEACEKAGCTDLAQKYHDAADYFWHTVADTRSLAIGGNSRREHFPSASDCISYTEEREGPESCNTNNMLKLTEGLYRMRRDGHYADFFERAMFNHILSSQHPGHGGYVYFTSARPGHYRVYSQPNSAMWCCVGTGMENHGKYGQFIYTHDDDALQVNLFVPSRVKWGNVTLTQNTAFPDDGTSRLTLECAEPQSFTLSIRDPQWCDAIGIKINGDDIHAYATNNGYIDITRTWADGDVIDIDLPMTVTLEEMPNVPQYVAIMRGPIVLGAELDTDDMGDVIAGDDRWGHIASGRLHSLDEVPMLIGDRDKITAKLNCMQRLPGDKATYRVEGLLDGEYADLVLRPFADIHDHRYMMYWLNMTDEQWSEHEAEMKAREAERLRIEGITVDAVNFGEQQPEADHHMKHDGSISGNYQGQSYRHAENGWFSCELDTKGLDDLKLMARYWGNETGKRTFDILIDDQQLTTCDNRALTGRSEFVERTYDIPSEMLRDKQTVTVTFRAHEGHTAGGVYYLRLINGE